MQIDHVLIGVADLDAATSALGAEHGLSAIGGGRHPGWGTANRIVPLGSAYLELVTVVDAEEAAHNAFGRWVTSMLDGGPAMGWALRTDYLTDTASRLDLEIHEGSRRLEDGTSLRWQLAGVAEAATDPMLPFFIRWSERTPLPGQADAKHAVGPATLGLLHLDGDLERLHLWTLAPSLPVAVHDGQVGRGGPAAVSISTHHGPVTLDAGDWTRARG